MKRVLASLSLCVSLAAPAFAASLADYTDAQTVSGLKEALTQSASFAVGKLGQVDGFFGNDKVKIPLPASLQRVEGMMRTFGMGKQADELILAMNRAAEAAVPEAKKILLDAVKGMSFEDAKNIVTGGEDAATQYFRRTTSSPLHDRFLPIVTKATQRVELAQKYDQFAGKAAKFGLVREQDAHLNEYVTNKALDGLYLMMAEEEKAIRQDPLGQGGRWLGKIFGATK
jgi:hypothetical protein